MGIRPVWQKWTFTLALLMLMPLYTLYFHFISTHPNSIILRLLTKPQVKTRGEELTSLHLLGVRRKFGQGREKVESVIEQWQSVALIGDGFRPNLIWNFNFLPALFLLQSSEAIYWLLKHYCRKSLISGECATHRISSISLMHSFLQVCVCHNRFLQIRKKG